MEWYGRDRSGSEMGTSGHGNELSGSIKCWEVLELLHSWQLLTFQRSKIVYSRHLLHRSGKNVKCICALDILRVFDSFCFAFCFLYHNKEGWIQLCCSRTIKLIKYNKLFIYGCRNRLLNSCWSCGTNNFLLTLQYAAPNTKLLINYIIVRLYFIP
jgi:hypothetical protein